MEVWLPIAIGTLLAVSPPAFDAEMSSRQARQRAGELTQATGAYQRALAAAGQNPGQQARVHLALAQIAEVQRDAETAGLHFDLSLKLAPTLAAHQGAARAQSFCSVDVRRGLLMRRFDSWSKASEASDASHPLPTGSSEGQARAALCGQQPCAATGPSLRNHSGPDVDGAHVGLYIAHNNGVLAWDPVVSLPQLHGCMPSATIQLGRDGEAHTLRATGSAVAPTGITADNDPCDLEEDESCSPMCMGGEQTLAVARLDVRGSGISIRVRYPGQAVFNAPSVNLEGQQWVVSGCAPGRVIPLTTPPPTGAAP